MKVTINEKEIELKYTLRAMMMYENVVNGNINPQSLTDMITLMYCITVCSAKDYNLSFEDFIDYVDEHPEFMTDFTKWVEETVTNQNRLKKD